jgi:two-component system, LytTR family, sensor kinase
MPRDIKIFIHATFWLFKMGTVFYFWEVQWYYKQTFLIFFIGLIILWFARLSFFYVNYLFLVPKFLLRKKYTTYCILLLLGCLMNVVAICFARNDLSFYEMDLWNSFKKGLMTDILLYFFVSTGLRIIEYWLESEKRKDALQEEVKKTELLYLKSQMSPHFLFNTLNNIYGLSLKNSFKTSKAIEQLKDMMLYFEDFEKGKKINIQDEVNYLNNYINLNKLRYSVKVNLDVNMPGVEREPVFVEPMLFLPFLENAFKHGDTSKESHITITLKSEKNAVYFSLNNLISKNKRKDSTGGIGIKNVQRRLELLYPQRHLLYAAANKDGFGVDLKISL